MSTALERIPPLVKKDSLVRRIVRYRQCYVFLLPTFLLLFVLNYYPAGSALYHSFFNWNGANVEVFVGFQNFVELLQDQNFHIAVVNVVKITLMRLAIALTFPLFAATLIYRMHDQKKAYTYKVLFVVPMVVTQVVVFLIWKFIYTPNGGVLNTLLEALGLQTFQRTWLGDFRTALYSIVFVGFPWISGFQMLIYLAGLQNISVSIIEASTLEGVGSVRRFFMIELPLIASQIKVIVILTVITAVQGFVDVMVMTNGGPGKATLVPGLLLYKNAMQYGKMGYASAIGTLLFVVILTLTYLNLKYMRSSNDNMG